MMKIGSTGNSDINSFAYKIYLNDEGYLNLSKEEVERRVFESDIEVNVDVDLIRTGEEPDIW